MKFFVDTANLDQIRDAQNLGVLDGVTTNPSLMAKEGITGRENILKHYVAICNIVDGDVSAEVISTDFKGMVKEGEALAKLHSQIVVKIPMILEGIKAIKHFSNKGIRTNCISLGLRSKDHVQPGRLSYIAFFVNKGANHQGEQVDENDNNENKDQQRKDLVVLKEFKIGADVISNTTCTNNGLIKHPLTDIGLEKFLADFKKGN